MSMSYLTLFQIFKILLFSVVDCDCLDVHSSVVLSFAGDYQRHCSSVPAQDQPDSDMGPDNPGVMGPAENPTPPENTPEGSTHPDAVFEYQNYQGVNYAG